MNNKRMDTTCKKMQPVFSLKPLRLCLASLLSCAIMAGCSDDDDNENKTAAPDTTAPVIAEVTPVTTPTASATPTMTFRSDEAGAIVYGGDCSSANNTSAIAGNNTITFNLMISGVHSNCTIKVKDAAGNLSAPLMVTSFTVTAPSMSIAHYWNEYLLIAIRKDRARPPIHARNLFHTSAAMYDIWAAFDATADRYLLGNTITSTVSSCAFNPATMPISLTATPAESRATAISFAMYRLIAARFSGSPGVGPTTAALNSLMTQLGYDKSFTGTNFTTGTATEQAAALGNYVAQCYRDYGVQDGSNEVGPIANFHGNSFYTPSNPPLLPKFPGTQSTPAKPVNFDLWQPLTLDAFVDQAGIISITGVPPFIGAEWGNVLPFALTSPTVNQRIYNSVLRDFKVYHDPGAPPVHTSAFYKWNFALVAKWSSHLDPNDPTNGSTIIDISPASIGNVPGSELPFPATETIADYENFYNKNTGGDKTTGHPSNPKASGAAYTPQMVKRGDYARVLTEFWADGPNSETPPGHWFTIFNYVTSKLAPTDKKFEGTGAALDDLQWDVKGYFTMGGAMHDAAISAWGIKGWYDAVRPITAIRAMGTSDNFAHIDFSSELLNGYIEVIMAGDPLAGFNNINVGKIKIRAWKGPNFITTPATQTAGVDWILAENFWPAQRPTFVTPPFAGYVSGHSTFSRAGADIMTDITNDPYFPGGRSDFLAKANQFLVFEDGPTTDITLEWATYRDASDQCSLSRIWGGIHPPFDDIPGRKIGSLVATEAVTKAKTYFDGTAM